MYQHDIHFIMNICDLFYLVANFHTKEIFIVHILRGDQTHELFQFILSGFLLKQDTHSLSVL